jgi:proteasome lid subunit RPN8/RPN11
MLWLSPQTLQAMQAHAVEGHPAEVCGLLVGRESADRQKRVVVEAQRVTNLRQDERRDRYELDPQVHLRVQKQSRRRGLRIIDVYHSHPDAAAVPSATDRDRARQIWGQAMSWSYLILPVDQTGAGTSRSWVLRNGEFDEETIERDDGATPQDQP